MNRYQVSIGGSWLHTYLNSDSRFKGRVYVQDIKYAEPAVQLTVETAGDADGGVITRKYRQKASVTVVFNVMTWDPSYRYAAVEAIRTLASKGGTILTSNRAGKALYNCVCEKYPEIESSKDRTQDIEMTFSTYAFPYWQDLVQTPKTLTGTRVSGAFTVPGNAPAAIPTVEITANADFPARGGYILQPNGKTQLDTSTTMKITLQNTVFMSFYPMKRNNLCIIDTDEHNNQRVRIYDSRTAYNNNPNNYRNGTFYTLPASSDKLLAVPGRSNNLAIEMGANATVTVNVRGAWL